MTSVVYMHALAARAAAEAHGLGPGRRRPWRARDVANGCGGRVPTGSVDGQWRAVPWCASSARWGGTGGVQRGAWLFAPGPWQPLQPLLQAAHLPAISSATAHGRSQEDGRVAA